MNRKYFFPFVATAFFMTSCSNGNTSDQHKDSGNTLQDTFPADDTMKESMKADSDAADHTHVDSLNEQH